MAVPELAAEALEALPVGAVLCDEARVVVLANRAFREMVRPVSPVGRRLDEVVQLDGHLLRAVVAEAWGPLRGPRERARESVATLRPTDGPPARVAVSARAVDGTAHVVVVVRPVDEELRQAALLRASQRRFERLARSVPAGIVSSEAGMRVDYANERACEIFDACEDELVGFGWLDRLVAEDVDVAEQAVDAVLGGGGPTRLTLRRTDAAGDVRWLDVRLAAVTTDGRDLGFVASIEDVTEAREMSVQLTTQALHDPLTGLPNRTALWQRAAELLSEVRCRPAVLCVDLDDFKAVNDALGHAAGDVVLGVVADRLRACSRDEDLVARYGADEFVLLLGGVEGRSVAEAVADRIVAGIEEPIVVDGEEIVVTASVGIVVAEADGSTDADTLLRDADAAMHQAKQAGKRRAALYDRDLRLSTQHRLGLQAALRRALDHRPDELQVHYQPIVDLATGGTVGVEALVRWQHPELGRVSPAEFVPVAEESGLVTALDRWVLDRALRDLAAWRLDPAGRHLHVAVNLSARDLADPGLVAEVAGGLDRHGVPAAALSLELTESAMMTDPERAQAVLEQLRGLGVKIAMDDFGTGYSSLAYLQRLPVDTLKIDRTFVADVDLGATELVEAIVALGRALRLPLVAEGIETLAQETRLRSLGVEYAQGYRFSPPTPAADIAALLAADRLVP